MNEQEKQAWFESYNKKMIRLSTIFSVGNVIVLFAIPFIMGLVLNALPDMPTFLKGFLNVAIIYYPTSIIEYLIYVPMLGTGASYLSFLTGNLSNLKIPCAINSRNMADTKIGTPENEIVSTLSVATSSLVTIVVLAIGVMLLVPLQPILENETLIPAFDNVVPALFGALGLKYFIKGRKFAGIPLIVSCAVCLLIPSLISQVSMLLLAIGALAIGVAYLFYKKNKLD